MENECLSKNAIPSIQDEIKNETEKKDFKLGISLYDENDTLLLEKTKEYKKEDITSILEDAEVFPLNETLKLDAIKKYSINITE